MGIANIDNLFRRFGCQAIRQIVQWLEERVLIFSSEEIIICTSGNELVKLENLRQETEENRWKDILEWMRPGGI